MAFVSVTRLHIRSWRFFVPFLIYTMRSGSQAKHSRGFRGGTIGNDAQRGNWTITMWDGEEAMRNFRNSGAHRVAMQKLLNWCDEASYAHYTTDEPDIPPADLAYQRLSAGKISKVNHPSAAHAQGRTVSAGMPRFTITLQPMTR